MLWKFKMYIKTLSLQQHQFSVRWELACFLLTTKWCIFKQIKFLKCYFKNKYLQILLFLPPPPLVTFHLSRFRENNLPTNGRKWLLYCLLLECWIVNVCSVGWGGGGVLKANHAYTDKRKKISSPRAGGLLSLNLNTACEYHW